MSFFVCSFFLVPTMSGHIFARKAKGRCCSQVDLPAVSAKVGEASGNMTGEGFRECVRRSLPCRTGLIRHDAVGIED